MHRIHSYIDALMTIPSMQTVDVKTITETDTKQIITDNDSNPLFERKIENATDGLNHDCFNWLYEKVAKFSKENAAVIANYIMSMKTETNLSDNYRRSIIMLLSKFSLFFKNQKTFKSMTREDILSFLDSFRKIEGVDPMHKWIGTYNTYRIHLMRFFKWLYFPDIEQDNRPKPSVIENIPQLKRKEKSIYKPTDLWSQQDDSLFLKYCPNPRDRCYHAMSRDSAARPHELLKLRIKDIVFKLTNDKKQYAEILVNGKTGARHIPLINSIPYIKDWISQHPQSGNPNSILLCGFGKSLGRIINIISLRRIYQDYKDKLFTKLLDNPNVLPEDKQQIRELLKKPWNPYIRRHSSLTEKAIILKEHTLRQFAGWSPASNMHLKYIHWFGSESAESILEAYGMVTKDKNQLSVLRSISCPNCNEPNKPGSRFCAQCKMVLTYDAYNETLEDQKEKESEVQRLQEKYQQEMKAMREEMESKFQQILTKIDVGNLK
jgi:integrase/recombinase XerD